MDPICRVLLVAALSVIGPAVTRANSIHRHHSESEANAAMDQLMLFGNGAPSMQPVASKSRRTEDNGNVAIDNAASFSPSSLDVPLNTAPLFEASGSAASPRRHRQSFTVQPPINEPGVASTVLDTIPALPSGRHHRGEVISLQSDVVLNSPISGAVSDGLNRRAETPLGDPLPGPSPVPEPDSLGLVLTALALAGMVYRKATAKA